MMRCERCGSAVAVGEAVCRVCGQPAGSRLIESTSWTVSKPPPNAAAVREAFLRLCVALAAVLLLAGYNLWAGITQRRVVDVIGGVVFAVLVVLIARKSLLALAIAAGIHGGIGLWGILTGRINLILAIGVRALVLVLILQAVGP